MPGYNYRSFTEIVDVHTPVLNGYHKTTYYEVGKLVFNLLPILLSRIKALGGPYVHEAIVSFRSHPAFCLIKNDPLESEKVKAKQAIEEFSKVRFLLSLVLFSGADNSELHRNKAVYPYLF